MLTTEKKKALIKGHNIAKGMEKPYVRFCADARIKQPYSFEELRKIAYRDTGDAAFLLGRYSDEILPYAKAYLESFRFPYSSLEVDGIKPNGDVNMALWLTKADLDTIEPHQYVTVLNDFSILEVLRKVDDWEEVFRKFNNPVKFLHQRQTSEFYGRKDPLLMEALYDFPGGDPPEMIAEIFPFVPCPPNTWPFYGGQPAAQWIIEFNRNVRENPHKFKEMISQYLPDTKK